MAIQENGSSGENLIGKNTITYSSFRKFINEGGEYLFNEGTFPLQSMPENWDMEFEPMSYETPLYVHHEDGFLALHYPLKPKVEEDIKAGEVVKDRIGEWMNGAKPCCHFESPCFNREESLGVYVFSDGISDEKCYQKFEKRSNDGSGSVINLERLGL